MNIFILDTDPTECAKMHNDVHVRKMIVESAQMLSTCYRMLHGDEQKRPSASGKTTQKYWELEVPFLEEKLYKAVHVNHPCTIWTRQSQAHWDWHVQLFLALCEEYAYRFGKIHKTDKELANLLSMLDPQIPEKQFLGFVTAMDQYPWCIVLGDAVQSYRNYYVDQKLSFTSYTKRNAPDWLASFLKI
jgi:hypothetical protein